jgi:transposase
MVVVNEVGRKLGETTVPTTTLGHTAVLKWVHSRFGTDVVWGVEDCRPLTARLELTFSLPGSVSSGFPRT